MEKKDELFERLENYRAKIDLSIVGPRPEAIMTSKNELFERLENYRAKGNLDDYESSSIVIEYILIADDWQFESIQIDNAIIINIYNIAIIILTNGKMTIHEM